MSYDGAEYPVPTREDLDRLQDAVKSAAAKGVGSPTMIWIGEEEAIRMGIEFDKEYDRMVAEIVEDQLNRKQPRHTMRDLFHAHKRRGLKIKPGMHTG